MKPISVTAIALCLGFLGACTVATNPIPYTAYSPSTCSVGAALVEYKIPRVLRRAIAQGTQTARVEEFCQIQSGDGSFSNMSGVQLMYAPSPGEDLKIEYRGHLGSTLRPFAGAEVAGFRTAQNKHGGYVIIDETYENNPGQPCLRASQMLRRGGDSNDSSNQAIMRIHFRICRDQIDGVKFQEAYDRFAEKLGS